MTTESQLWGFADLHAHPASHLGFGARPDGTGGILWGKPGLRLENADRTIPSDLAPCAPDKHDGFDIDPVRDETRKQIIANIGRLTGLSHTSKGWPDFDGWPHAQSVLHQQMHISWIHRAWQGGLRLMIASVTDNQALVTLWRRGFDVLGSQPRPDANFEFESARTQLAFIRALAEANASWMDVVESPTEARRVISSGKLAIILSLEMDTLTGDQIIALKREFGVRHVTPIHLADNSFGGVAVYSDLFNSSNYYLNERFYQVEGDPNLEFRLARPEYLAVGVAGSVAPKKIDDTEYRTLGYECFPGARVPCVPADQGHKNVRGLVRAELERLMVEGLLIDLAHMSDKSQEDAIRLAEQLNFPVMNSHTGLRPDSQPAHSERSMRRSLAERMARLGGVLGLGTEGGFPGVDLLVLESSQHSPVVRFRADQREWLADLTSWPRDRAKFKRLDVTIVTGGDDLRQGSQAIGVVTLRGRGTLEFPLNRGASWGNNSTNKVSFDLPQLVTMADLQSFGIRYASGKPDVFSTTDNWNINALTVDLESGATLLNLSGSPLMRFTGDRRAWSAPLQRTEPVAVNTLELTIRTGGDDLRRNSQATAVITLRNGSELTFPLNEGAEWGNGSVHTRTLTLPATVKFADLASFGIRHQSGKTGPFDGHDNWDIASIRLEHQGRRRNFLRLSGAPLVRFTGEQSVRTFFQADGVPGDTVASHLRVSIQTSGDELRADSNAFAVVVLNRNQRMEFPLSKGATWENGSVHNAIIALPAGTRRSNITAFGIRYVPGGSSDVNRDNWSVGRVQVQILGDAVAQWVEGYLDANAAMQNRGVALGTDMNGYAPQVPFSRRPVTYPIDVATRHADPRARTAPPRLERSRVGNRTFDFTHDGAAHYGMLPDFLQAIGMHTNDVQRLFRTAEDVVQMWERVEAAQEDLRRRRS